MSWLARLDLLVQALVAAFFAWTITALGALLVFLRGLRSAAAVAPPRVPGGGSRFPGDDDSRRSAWLGALFRDRFRAAAISS